LEKNKNALIIHPLRTFPKKYLAFFWPLEIVGVELSLVEASSRSPTPSFS